MNFHFHGNLHVHQIQIQLPPAPPTVSPVRASPPQTVVSPVVDTTAATPEQDDPDMDVQVEFHPVRRPNGRRLLQRLRSTRNENNHPNTLRQTVQRNMGSLFDLMQPYESLLETSGLHDLFEADRDNVTLMPTHSLILQHLPVVDAPGGECAICTEATPDQPWTKLEPCGHVFHRHCCRTWLTEHNTCPLCRQTVRLNTDHLRLHQLLEMRNALGLPRSEVVERTDLERQLQEHLS